MCWCPTRCVIIISTRFYRLHLVGIDSVCFINSTSSGKDRLNVFIESIDLVVGLASFPRRWEWEARLSTAELYVRAVHE